MNLGDEANIVLGGRQEETMHCPVCETGKTRFLLHAAARCYWRCCVCKATFLDPSQLPGLDEERAYYGLHRNETGDVVYRQFLWRLASPLLERLPAGKSGLDYGCGPCPALSAMLREAGHTMALYDPFFFDDSTVLAKTYDFITCTEVVEHFHRPAEEFRRLGGMLNPDGMLAIMTSFQTEDAHFAAWHYRRDPTHVVFYREQTFRHLARLHGWTCEIPRPNVALLRKRA